MKLVKNFVHPINVLCTLMICFLTLSLNAQDLKSVHVPDSMFRAVLSSSYGITFDSNNNISNPDSAANIKKINVYLNHIKNLAGIEAFTGLQILYCHQNELTELDVTHNTNLVELHCFTNNLNSIDVTGLRSLTVLNCTGNKLTSLNVSTNSNLINLNVTLNYLTTIVVSKNIALERLAGKWNKLTSLNVSMNSGLTDLAIANNELTALDISKNIALVRLEVSGNKLASLNVSMNIALTDLAIAHNELTALDVSRNLALEKLVCSGNKLSYLDLSKSHKLIQLDYGDLSSEQVTLNADYENYLSSQAREQAITVWYNQNDIDSWIWRIIDVIIILLIFYLIIKSPHIKKISKKLLILMSVVWIINMQIELWMSHGSYSWDYVLQLEFWAASLIVLFVFLIVTRKTKKAKWDWFMIFLITPIVPILFTMMVSKLSNSRGLSYYLSNMDAIPLLSIELIGVLIILGIIMYNRKKHLENKD